jgi:hypothetical protein
MTWRKRCMVMVACIVAVGLIFGMVLGVVKLFSAITMSRSEVNEATAGLGVALQAVYDQNRQMVELIAAAWFVLADSEGALVVTDKGLTIPNEAIVSVWERAQALAAENGCAPLVTPIPADLTWVKGGAK